MSERFTPDNSLLHLDPRGPYQVRFTVKKGDRPLVSDEVFYDDFGNGNPRIFDQYEYHWVGESVVDFGGKVADRRSLLDEVVVTNDSDEAIHYLLVQSAERFLILDLPSRASVHLLAHHQTAHPWIDCTGKFASGKGMVYFGRNFELDEFSVKPIAQRYTVNIGDEGTYINTAGPR